MFLYILFNIYCPDKYKTQKKCDEAVDDYLAALKFIPDWFVISKMIKKLYALLYADENILYFNEDSDDAVFSCNEIDILCVDLNNLNFDDTNYDSDGPETFIHIRLLARHSKFKKGKALKKNK